MIVDKIALLLAIVGALNWGGIGLFGFDTVGLAGLWCITLLFRNNEETGHAPHTAS